MNLIVPAIWYVVVISCSVSIPRPKHQHTKYPISKLKYSCSDSSDATALEILEKKLLQPHTEGLNKRHSKCKQKVHFKRPMKHKSEILPSINEHYGKKNLLCNPKKNLKKLSKHGPIKRSFQPKKRYFKTKSPLRSSYSTIEDFFGLFTTESSAKDSWKTILTFQSPYISDITNSSPNPSLNISGAKKGFSLPANSISVKPKVTSVHPTLIVDRFKPLFDNLIMETKGTTGKNTSSVSGLKLQPESNVFFKDRVENPKHDMRRYYYKVDDDDENEEHSYDNRENEPTESVEVTEPTHTSGVEMTEESNPDEETSANEITEESKLEEETSVESISDKETTKSIIGEGITTLKTKKVKEGNVLSSSTYDKNKCESDNDKKCVCSFTSLNTDLHSIFSKANDPKIALKEFIQLHCRKYMPKPEKFELSANLKPKILSANKKPMAVDEGKGPKEIEQKSLDEFIALSSSEDDDVSHVFVNTDVKIPCFPSNDVHLSANNADNVKFKWSHGNKKAITEGRVTENEDGEGSLSIEEASISDSENYTCDLEYVNPDTGHRTQESFTHVISVVTLPIVTARVSVHYRAPLLCDAAVLEMFQLYLPQQVEAALCDSGPEAARLCSVEVHSPVCHNEKTDVPSSQERPQRRVQSNTSVKPYWLREKRQDLMEMSLNLEVYIHRLAERLLTGGNSSLCSATCHLLISFKLLQLFKESMVEVAQTPVHSSTDHVDGVFNPVKSSIKVKYIFGCIGGYHLDNGFCVACPKHTFSEDGATECTDCPPHTYQGSMGARQCIPCASAWIPACNEYFEDTNIIIIVLVASGIVMLLLGLVLWYKFKVKHKTMSDMKKLLKPHKRRAKTVKFAKSSQRKAKSETTDDDLRTLLESSTGESADDEESSKR